MISLKTLILAVFVGLLALGGANAENKSLRQPEEHVEHELQECVCVALCDQCGGGGTADCKTVCEYAKDDNCVELCDAALHIPDNTGGTGIYSTIHGATNHAQQVTQLCTSGSASNADVKVFCDKTY